MGNLAHRLRALERRAGYGKRRRLADLSEAEIDTLIGFYARAFDGEELSPEDLAEWHQLRKGVIFDLSAVAGLSDAEIDRRLGDLRVGTDAGAAPAGAPLSSRREMAVHHG